MKRKPYNLVRTHFWGSVFASLGVKNCSPDLKDDYGTRVEIPKDNSKPNTKGVSRVLTLSRKILKCNKKPTIKGD